MLLLPYERLDLPSNRLNYTWVVLRRYAYSNVAYAHTHVCLDTPWYSAHLVRRTKIELGGAADQAWVASYRGAMIVQHVILALGFFRRAAAEVPHIGVLGDHAQ